jgi:hypothetical protein
MISASSNGRSKNIRVLAVIVASVSGKGAQRCAHQTVTANSNVPLSSVQDRRWSVFLHACVRRPRQRSAGPLR